MKHFLKEIEKTGRIYIKKFLSNLLSPSLNNSLNLSKIKNVIIVRIDERLGNLVLLNAVVKSFIKNKLNVTLIICKKFGEIYKYTSNIQKIIYFNKKSLFNPFKLIYFIYTLKKTQYDLLFDASNPNDLSTLTYLTILLIRAKIKFGYKRKESEYILNKTIPLPTKKIHILDYYKNLFTELNLKFFKDIKFKFPSYIRKKYQHLQKRNKQIIIIHPGGRSTKRWSVEKLIKFLKMIYNSSYEFLIILGPDEKNFSKKFLQNGFKIFIPKNIFDLISFLSIGKIYIGNDTGPMHLAASLGLSIFAIFKPDASVTFTPVAKFYHIIKTPSPPQLEVNKVYKEYKKFLKKLKN